MNSYASMETTTMKPNFSPLDRLVVSFDKGLQTIATKHHAARPNPAATLAEAELTTDERRHIAGLMRVNHAGEISAQALYLGQAITARSQAVREEMQIAADEEIDHLAWCEDRLAELQSHTSYLAPFWFLGSFIIGTLAGIVGDEWNLGFVAETEQQVVKHLENHLTQVPLNDVKTRGILAQMRDDEAKHQQMALQSGAKILPEPMKKLMSIISKFMTLTAYRI